MDYYYFSLQFSAIQKVVLRHDRLWSIAGISNILSRLNEVEMPSIVEQNDGKAIVAGGGKFTARFLKKDDALAAKKSCVATVATTLPMLEFQVTEDEAVAAAESFQSLAGNSEKRNPILAELSQQKRQFRGYAFTCNPHLKLCGECGEYPALEQDPRGGSKEKNFCRICHAAYEESRHIHSETEAHTTLQKVYHGYLSKVPSAIGKKPAADFNDLFPENHDDRKRMAVWFSDINNMNDKVPVWLRQEDESNVLETFRRFHSTIVEIVVTALAATFPECSGDFFPFRLVVAGGDDLCLVMAEKDILSFAQNISAALNDVKKNLADDHPLSDIWLKNNGFAGVQPKPFGFGSSFIITSTHTPFRRIHQLGEELMSDAKRISDRQGNCVNWRIMAEEDTTTEVLLAFEKPLFIESCDRKKNDLNHLTLADYKKLLDKYAGKPSGAQMQQIVAIMQEEKNPWILEQKLKLLDVSVEGKSFSFLLRDDVFRDDSRMLLPQRIATFFELKAIAGGFAE